MSAPERSSLARMRSSRVTSSATVMRLVWIWKILLLVFSSGRGNSIFRSIRPEKEEDTQNISLMVSKMPRQTNSMRGDPTLSTATSSNTNHLSVWGCYSPVNVLNTTSANLNEWINWSPVKSIFKFQEIVPSGPVNSFLLFECNYLFGLFFKKIMEFFVFGSKQAWEGDDPHLSPFSDILID